MITARASKMSRLMRCPGSYKLCTGKPVKPDPEAELGTLAHAEAANVVHGKKKIDHIVDIEMRNGVEIYINVVKQYSTPLTKCMVEESHKITTPGGNFIQGTADFVSLGVDKLVVADLKYGHKAVDVCDNWQLITYAVLMCDKYYPDDRKLPKTVKLIIIQPRANHPGGIVRFWEFDSVLLRNYRNIICGQVDLAATPNAPTESGNHCYKCPAILDCFTNREAVSIALSVAKQSTDSGEMSGVEIAYDLMLCQEASKLISNRLDALELTALNMITVLGQQIPGYRAEQSMSALGWDVDDPIGVAKYMDVDISQPAKPLTPTQVIQRKLLSKEQVGMLASRKPSGFKLKPENVDDFIKKLIKGS